MLPEVKRIEFVKSPDDSYQSFQECILAWYNKNRANVDIKHAVFNNVKKQFNDVWYDCVCFRISYVGEGGTNPQECNHATTTVSVVKQPTCTEKGLKRTVCSTCGLTVKEESIDALGHDWVSNNDGTHSCSRGDVVNETCSPNDYEDECDKCGYKTPADTVLKILTTSLPDARMDTNYNLQLESNVQADTLWTAVDKLPKGLYLTRDGILHGIVEEYDKYTIKVNAHYHNQDVQKEYQLNVIDLYTLEITTNSLPGMVANEISEDILIEASTPDNLTTWSLKTGTLPTGVTFDPDTHTISGTPTTSGMYKFTVEASYHDQTVQKEFTLYVAKQNCVVSFSANGGDDDIDDIIVPEGSVIGTLPTPTFEGNTFGGWYTAAVGGLRVDETYTVVGNITLYAHWAESSDIVFGDVTTQFNIQIDGDRTNYDNQPYTLYGRVAGDTAADCNLAMQTGISSDDGSNNMSDTNKNITLYLKITNNGDAGYFDIGFDCDSYVTGDDNVKITRIDGGVALGDNMYTVTVPYENTVWIGRYDVRVENRYVDSNIGDVTPNIDTGYALTMRNIFINSGSYTILHVEFVKN